jgi:hypothetical protein
MAKHIRNTGPTYPVIRNTGPTYRSLDVAEVAAALGGDLPGVQVEPTGGNPIDMLARAMEHGKRSQAEAERRQQIPVSDAQWKQLDDLAAALSSNGSAPLPGQVAAAVLSVALRSLANASEEQRAALAQELAALGNGPQADARPTETKEP